MFDFPFSPEADRVGREAAEAGSIVAAVCHGPIVFANIHLSSGELLIAGKKVAGFTNEEEAVVGLVDKLPEHAGKGRTLEDVLTAVGAVYGKAAPWNPFVVSDGQVFSGQNPQSAGPLADAIINKLAT